MAWRIYKHTDTGAPLASNLNTYGQFSAILRACLIDGYGSGVDLKTPQGNWEEPFPEANNVSVFRSLTGNRQFYQFSDNKAYSVEVNAYESMTAVDNGIGNWVLGSKSTYFGKHYNSGYGWIVLANDTTVIWISIDGYASWAPHMFGEFESIWSAYPYNNMVAGNSTYTYRGAQYGPFSSLSAISRTSITGPRIAIHRLPDGTGLGAMLGCNSITANLAGPSSVSYMSNPLPNKKPILSPIFIGGVADTVSAPSGSSFYYKYFNLGIIPLILAMDSPLFEWDVSFDETREWTDIDTGTSYLLLPFGLTSWDNASYDQPRSQYAIPLEGVS